MEEAANKIVRYLYDNLGDKQTGEKSCALVRFYKTNPFGDLDEGLQEFARGILGTTPESPTMRCLTLLATVGDQPEWNSRANSNGHKAIPLASEQFVAGIPMIARLVNQFGLEASAVLKPDSTRVVDLERRTFNTFYVPEVPGSPYVPAQEQFVIPFGIKSALGFGGILTSGELFAIILFSKVPIPRETAETFKDLAPRAKEAVTPFVDGAVFA